MVGSHTAAIVLAAGAGTRFGGGKMLVPVHGRPVLQHVLDRVAAAGIRDVVVVLGDDFDAVEQAIGWGDERRVLNPDPGHGLSGSLRLGMAALAPDVDAALIVLGDQPLVRVATIRALLDAPPTPIVAPRYSDEGGRNPLLLRSAAFDLIQDATGDRGLGPVLAAHPELVGEIAVPGANPDLDTSRDLILVLTGMWSDRVRANREQVDAIREVPDGADFYAPVHSLFRADPARTDDPVLDVLLGLVEPGETWLDVGAGAGRFALPIARALAPTGGRVVAVDVSVSMLTALREIADEHGVQNVQAVEGRWPLETASARGDVGLIAHVGYDIEDIGGFLGALESAVSRLCVGVLMNRAPASAADAFWPLVHDQDRVPLPGMPELIELLQALGQSPIVRYVQAESRSFDSRETIEGFARRQLWIDPGGQKEGRFQDALDRLTVEEDGRWRLRDRSASEIGIVTWRPGAGDYTA
jgi:CTP:molybdopterin cytidylyltransferase MocA